MRIDLNTLFGFCKDITKQELARFCKEIREKTLADGFDAGFSAAREILREYPNSETLLHQIALQMQGLMAVAEMEPEKIERYRKEIGAWYLRLAESEEPTIRNSACFVLASEAIGEEQYESAQAYLDRMPNRNDTPDKRILQTTILLKQNRAEEAAAVLEQMLLTALNEVLMVLFKLIDADMAMEDGDAAAYAAERATKLAEAFDLHPYHKLVASFLVAAAKQDAEQALPLLKGLLSSMSDVWSPRLSPLYRQLPILRSDATMAHMRGLLIQALRQAPEYAFLRTSREFQTVLAEFDSQ